MLRCHKLEGHEVQAVLSRDPSLPYPGKDLQGFLSFQYV